MQYTIRNVPVTLDEALRRAAREQDKSLNEVAIEALIRGAGVTGGECSSSFRSSTTSSLMKLSICSTPRRLQIFHADLSGLVVIAGTPKLTCSP